jgi:hypothetical protein
MMVAAGTYETSADICRAVRRNNTEDSRFHELRVSIRHKVQLGIVRLNILYQNF